MALGLVLAGLMASAGAQAPGLRIVSPAPDETIHGNAGTITVVVAGVAPGTPLRAVLDGVASTATYPAPTFKLQAVPRGSHQLVVELPDSSGDTIGRSPPVQFHVWQASRLNPPR